MRKNAWFIQLLKLFIILTLVVSFLPQGEVRAAVPVLSISPASGPFYDCADYIIVKVADVTDLMGYDILLQLTSSIPGAIEIMEVTNAGWLDTQAWTIPLVIDNTNLTIRAVMTQLNPSQPKSGSGDLLRIRIRTLIPGATVGVHIININDIPTPTLPTTLSTGASDIEFTPVDGSFTTTDECPFTPHVYIDPIYSCIPAIYTSFTMAVNVKDAVDLWGYSLRLSYDPGSIMILGVTNGTFLQPVIAEPTNSFSTPGSISWGVTQLSSVEPQTGSGTLLTINGIVITTTPSTVNINILETSRLIYWNYVTNPPGGPGAPADVEVFTNTNGVIQIGGCDPTSVDLMTFTATAAAESIILNWETTNEIDNLGYNLYRADTMDGVRTRINNTLIPTNVAPGSMEGAVYTYTDTGADLISGFEPGHTYYYWLESVDIHGTTSLDGSCKVTTDGSLPVAPSPTSSSPVVVSSPTLKPPVAATSVPPTRTATSPVIVANSYIVVNTLAPTSLPAPTDIPMLTATAAPTRVGFTLTSTIPAAAEPTDQAAAPASIQPAAESPSEELTQAGLFQIKNWWTLLVWLVAGIAAGGVYFFTKQRAERKEDHK